MESAVPTTCRRTTGRTQGPRDLRKPSPLSRQGSLSISLCDTANPKRQQPPSRTTTSSLLDLPLSALARIGIGVYVAGAGGLITALGGIVMRQSPLADTLEGEPTIRCPDCAETILAAAHVCKHCGHRLTKPDGAATPAV
jgi:DNA-directed RNA polymerase subunit RPC12/RpoP